ncbi:uncharacterized protein LOC116351418 isoform X2 [Contarinia nasturtii]|uniref:uncharacterized protein LOC116351418 isoform X2 n=1 Tax=Contarinia nasturtii TaxID=265458 RepID=UPI0012D479C6|nr:uncharacterized protein LOC116351418 isoform X2 [Contarinia nasturtii]
MELISRENALKGSHLYFSLFFYRMIYMDLNNQDTPDRIRLDIFFVLCFTTILLSLSKFYPDSCFHNSWFNKLYHAMVWILCEVCSFYWYLIFIGLWIEDVKLNREDYILRIILLISIIPSTISNSLNHILLIQHHIFKSKTNVYIYLVKSMRFGLYVTWIIFIGMNFLSFRGARQFFVIFSQFFQIVFISLYSCCLVTYISEMFGMHSESEHQIMYVSSSDISLSIFIVKKMISLTSYPLLLPEMVKLDPEHDSLLGCVFGLLWFSYVRFSYMNNIILNIQNSPPFVNQFTLEDIMQYFRIPEAYCKQTKYIQS